MAQANTGSPRDVDDSDESLFDNWNEYNFFDKLRSSLYAIGSTAIIPEEGAVKSAPKALEILNGVHRAKAAQIMKLLISA